MQRALPGFFPVTAEEAQEMIDAETMPQRGAYDMQLLLDQGLKPVRYHIILRADGLVDIEYIFVAVVEHGATYSHFELAYYDALMRTALENGKYNAAVLKTWRIHTIKEIE